MSPVFSFANLLPIILFAVAIIAGLACVIALIFLLRSLVKRKTRPALIWLLVLSGCAALCVLTVSGNIVRIF